MSPLVTALAPAPMRGRTGGCTTTTGPSTASEVGRSFRRRSGAGGDDRRVRAGRPLLLVVLSLALSACGAATKPAGGSPTATSARTTPHRSSAPAGSPAGASGPAAVHARVQLVGRLPSPVQDPATTALAPDGALLLGGLDQADTSVASILRVRGGTARRSGTLPSALHDAAAATIGRRAYLFGGGNLGSSAAILREGHKQVGALPVAASDVAAATLGASVYIVGGYDGSRPLDTIVAWHPGGASRVVGRLPLALRYAAVTAVAGRLLIAGGTSGVAASRLILTFDPATRRVRRLGRLPQPITHAAAGTLAGRVLVLGGRGSGLATQSREIIAIDPVNGRTSTAGRLPRALSDLGAATLADRILLAGGRDRGGTVHGELYDVSAIR